MTGLYPHGNANLEKLELMSKLKLSYIDFVIQNH